MAWSSKYIAELGIVETIYRGPTTRSDIKEATTASISAARQAGTTRGLVDATDILFAASLVDLYDLPASQFECEQLDRRSRIAVLLPKDAKAREAAHFYQAACLNRGWNAKAFADREAAIVWLRAESV